MGRWHARWVITEDTPVRRTPVAPDRDLPARLLDFLEHRAAPAPDPADTEIAARLWDVPAETVLRRLADDVTNPARDRGEQGRADVARPSGTGSAPRPRRLTDR